MQNQGRASSGIYKAEPSEEVVFPGVGEGCVGVEGAGGQTGNLQRWRRCLDT